jgi:CrcB protein
MLSTVLQVAAGGAIGAALRYLAGVGVVRLIGRFDFPVAILLVNVLGSTLMGLFVGMAATRGWTPLNAFIGLGILGGFTTFSSFSLETMTLIQRGEAGLAALYVAASVSLSVGGLALGLVLGRGLGA